MSNLLELMTQAIEHTKKREEVEKDWPLIFSARLIEQGLKHKIIIKDADGVDWYCGKRVVSYQGRMEMKGVRT